MTWTKEMPANPVVAIAGATGAVGAEFLQVLHDVDFPASEVRALASARSAGKTLPFAGCGQVPAGELVVQEMRPESFEGVDIALFSCGAGVSREMREAVAASGAVMIDNSSAFRMDEDVPLVVPEVNPGDVAWHNGVIANPNCSTIQMVVALKPLYDLSPIKRVVSHGAKVYTDKLDYAQALVTYEDGLVASLTASRVTESKVREATVSAKDAFVTVDYLNRTVEISRKTNFELNIGHSMEYKQENIVERVFVPIAEPLRSEFAHFAACIHSGDEVKTSGEMGKRAVELCMAISQGALVGQQSS